ncbi:hypothetical protein IF2G_08346 [Cordyceps javanica]|nr:hypothetical protein IF2G_08346 [Cordyceps javanica]
MVSCKSTCYDPWPYDLWTWNNSRRCCTHLPRNCFDWKVRTDSRSGARRLTGRTDDGPDMLNSSLAT